MTKRPKRGARPEGTGEGVALASTDGGADLSGPLVRPLFERGRRPEFVWQFRPVTDEQSSGGEERSYFAVNDLLSAGSPGMNFRIPTAVASAIDVLARTEVRVLPHSTRMGCVAQRHERAGDRGRPSWVTELPVVKVCCYFGCLLRKQCGFESRRRESAVAEGKTRKRCSRTVSEHRLFPGNAKLVVKRTVTSLNPRDAAFDSLPRELGFHV